MLARERPGELGTRGTRVPVAVILLGSGLRLANLEGKPYWFDASRFGATRLESRLAERQGEHCPARP